MSRKYIEIGSEFWKIPVGMKNNTSFPGNMKWFLSGRIALSAIIEDIKKNIKFSTAALPDWCCDSMILPFLQRGISVSFYDAFNPPDDFETDAALVMDYFGYSSGKTYCGYSGTIIRDVTHSLFSKPHGDASYYFGSLRKWAGFYTGGYAWGFKAETQYAGENERYIRLRTEAMRQKDLYLSGTSVSKDYLRIFSEAEELLENAEISPACERDIALAEKLDATGIKASRRENAAILLENFSDIAVFPEIRADDCPMFVPIRVKNRDGLRRWLIENEIYCPVHWPLSVYHTVSRETRKLYEEELSLVCDQRYGVDDMQRLVETIKKYDGR